MQNELDIVRDGDELLRATAHEEDLIHSKLHWAKDSRPEMRLGDVRNLISTGCDREYIERWTRELDVVNLWLEVTHE